MGDRGNIILRYNTGSNAKAPQDIYLYTHWGGSEIPGVVQAALRKRWRWEDPGYLARIVFDELVPTRGEETGFGISPEVMDNEHDFLLLDLDANRVERINPDTGQMKRSWSFEEYIKLDLDIAKGLKDF